MNKSTRYDLYNREERALCFHLFRLLHEKLDGTPEDSALFRLLRNLSEKKLDFKNNEQGINLTGLGFDNAAIYPEVALIRDAYENLKPRVSDFMDGLVNIVKRQEDAGKCRLYSQLPEVLSNHEKTHPRQMRTKARMENIPLGPDETKVYGAVQAMFNAKPDLAITVDNYLIVFEAKFTEQFDEAQLGRTWKIAEVWASHLLYRDLGFENAPAYAVVRLGLSRHNPDLSWYEIMQIAEEYYSENDRSYLAFKNALQYEERGSG